MWKTQARLGTDMQGVVETPLPGEPGEDLLIRAERPGFVPMQLDLVRGPTALTAPVELPFRLEPAVKVGGLVRDDEGAPRAGALVTLALPRDTSAPCMPVREIWNRTATTDEQGRWTIDGIPADFRVEELRARVDVDGYCTEADLAPIKAGRAELIAGTAVLTCKWDGRKRADVEGVVLDEDGRPIEQALVSLVETPNWRMRPPVHTDAEGRFRIEQAGGRVVRGPNREIFRILELAEVLARAPGYAAATKGVKLTGEIPRLEFRLVKAPPLAGQVVTDAGAALPGARVAIEGPLGVSATTDADGRFMLDELPRAPLELHVTKAGFADERWRESASRPAEVVITLKRGLRVGGRVVDARTGEPVPLFALTMGERSDIGGLNWMDGTRRLVIGGAYEVDFPSATASLGVRVQAAGYMLTEEWFSAEPREQHFDFVLEPSDGRTVTIRRPDGAPAAHAAVYVCARDPSGFSVQFKDGEPQRTSHLANSLCLPQHCDVDGRFRLDPLEREYAVIVLDPAGYAEFSEEDLDDDAVVKLRRWARVEGFLRRGKAVRPDVGVMLSVDGHSRQVVHRCKQKTAADGRFVFERVVPGRARVEPWPATRMVSEYGCVVRLSPGVNEIIVGTRGRPVVGKIILPAGERFEPGGAHEFPRLAGSPFETDEEEPAQRNPRELLPTYFQGAMEPDGAFRFEDVPPGHWRIEGFFQLASRNMGQVWHSFELEEMPEAWSAEPLDLGELQARLVSAGGDGESDEDE
ncbi:MAG: carboxypeptidase-like regulatory domain-containing protein [Planctomycetota bacterium]